MMTVTAQKLERIAYVRLTQTLYERLSTIADKEERDVSYLIRRAIEQYLNRKKVS